MNIIQQLKDNEKPFGLMSEEMQEKAREVGQPEFEMYMKDDTWMRCGGCNNFHSPKITDQTYRLRPDFAEEPEIVECEIYVTHRQLMYMGQSGPTGIHKACKDPDHIGFKFEDGAIGPTPIHYRDAGGDIYCKLGDGRLDEITVLHATHVLFRRQK